MTLLPAPSDAELLAEAKRRLAMRDPAFLRSVAQASSDNDQPRRRNLGPNAIASAFRDSEKPKRKNAHPEHDIQAALFARIMDEKYDMPILRQAYAIPNAAIRGKLTRIKMLQEGLRAGELDINLDLACGGYFGLRLEIKAPGGRLSVLQAARVEEHRANGYCVEIAETVDDAEKILRRYASMSHTQCPHSKP